MPDRRSRTTLAALAGVLALPALAAAGAGVAVGGHVWLDVDGDGQRGVDEPGRGDVPVSLVGDAGVVDATTTDGDGRWSFAGVPDGDWRVVAGAPPDLVFRTVDGGLSDDGEARLRVEGAAVDGLDAALVTGSGGGDLVLDVHLAAARPDAADWTVRVANPGGLAVPGPVQVRVVLDEGLAVTDAAGGGWTCVPTGSVVTCDRPGDLPARSALPRLDLTTVVDGPAGTTLAVTATGSGSRVDAAPRNDEDTATVVAGTTAADGGGIDAGGPEGALSQTGGTLPGPGWAAVAAGLVGAAMLRAARRPS